MRVIASDAVLAKLSVLDITIVDVEEALFILEELPIVDDRPQNRTRPPTVWFVSTTLDDRILFVAGIFDAEEDVFVIRTARDADDRDMERWNNGKW